MNHKASIGMFQRKLDYSEETQPTVPDELFLAAERVVKEKGCEIVKTPIGIYVVNYSETGPFQEGDVADEFLPVWVARLQTWSSGGIKNSEMEAFKCSYEGEKNENPTN